MNLSVQTAVPQAGLIQRFNDLAQDLASHDARL
ncbi:MAG: hypothetical protein JWN72_2506, partial [Thermoleophilia bacterium]|nr:hypothetical protein [Thermoleophilia bacterium]